MFKNSDESPGDGTHSAVPSLPMSIAKLRPPNTTLPLERFSLIKSIDELEATTAKQEPLLGDLCLTTQTTVIFAKPNSGKTLIALHLLRLAVGAARIEGSKCFYVAADDNPNGVIEKQKLLQPFGVHVIAPGLNNFSTVRLVSGIEEMIHTASAAGSFLIVDTLKKFADLMDKKASSAFVDLARRYVMAGGTLLGLAHTNKRTDKDGKPIFGGTSDILDDFDCAYTMRELPQKSRPNERVVIFESLKRRGNVVQEVAYRYSTSNGLAYADILASVSKVDGDELDRIHGEADQEADAEAIAAIEDCIKEGLDSKQELKREVAKRARVGQHKVSAIIDRYNGPDPSKHRWDFQSLGHGRRAYQLHGSGSGPGMPAVDPKAIF